MLLAEKRTGNPLPRTEKLGDLITADHKVLSEGCESWNNHLDAVGVQDVATQVTDTEPSEQWSSGESRFHSTWIC